MKMKMNMNKMETSFYLILTRGPIIIVKKLLKGPKLVAGMLVIKVETRIIQKTGSGIKCFKKIS